MAGMAATRSEFSVTVKRGDELIQICPYRNGIGKWELDLQEGIIPGGFPLEVTLPPFRHLQALKL